MNICSHTIRYGLAEIPAEGGDYCTYCVQEDIEKNAFNSKYACKTTDCSGISEKPHWHPDDVEAIGTPRITGCISSNPFRSLSNPHPAQLQCSSHGIGRDTQALASVCQ